MCTIKRVRMNSRKQLIYCGLSDSRIRKRRRAELLKICGSSPSMLQVCQTLIEDVWHGPYDTEPRIPRSWRFAWRLLRSMRTRYPSADDLLREWQFQLEFRRTQYSDGAKLLIDRIRAGITEKQELRTMEMFGVIESSIRSKA
jgi:hypothetical protein